MNVIARFAKHSEFLMASIPIRVFPHLHLLTPSTLLLPPSSDFKILTNMDGISALSYQVVATPCTCPCEESSVEGVHVSSDGVVRVDASERNFVVVVSVLEETEGAVFRSRQAQQVYFEVRHIVSLSFSLERNVIGIKEKVKASLVVQDNRGLDFAPVLSSPRIEVFDSVQGIVEVMAEAGPYEFTITGVKKGFTTLMVWLPDYEKLINYSYYGLAGAVDYLDVTVEDTADSYMYSTAPSERTTGGTSVVFGLNPEDYKLLIVVALSVFINLWLFCFPRMSGNSNKAFQYNLLHPNARVPRG